MDAKYISVPSTLLTTFSLHPSNFNHPPSPSSSSNFSNFSNFSNSKKQNSTTLELIKISLNFSTSMNFSTSIYKFSLQNSPANWHRAWPHSLRFTNLARQES
eukprot:Pompholyxophrys_punicea_v1_NODE_363_length_2160_cov_5.160095.p1 type:complete len:102 gc:universal NODE_363_length_2160_cov_5.160095:483-788(+)